MHDDTGKKRWLENEFTHDNAPQTTDALPIMRRILPCLFPGDLLCSVFVPVGCNPAPTSRLSIIISFSAGGTRRLVPIPTQRDQ